MALTSNILYDISPVLSESSPVWPGDQRLERSWQCQLSLNDNIDLSAIYTTVHIGAHADAPSHFCEGEPSIDQVDLHPYLGPCQVIEVLESPTVQLEDLKGRLVEGCSRILVKSASFDHSGPFNKNFVSFSVAAVTYLAEQGVILVGIDTPSVDHFASKDLEVHHLLLRNRIRNLEGLDLREVPEGVYELIALPLRLAGFDASPVRAILRSL